MYWPTACARSTGRPGVICIVPGPGVTNALTGIGEALLDSVPMVCIIGDVARGDHYHPFQLHEIPQAGLIQQVTKGMFTATCVADIPVMVGQAFQLAMAGEPGPTAVVVPYNLLTDTNRFFCPPIGPPELTFDEAAFACALDLLRNRRLRVGIYAGMGCMDYSTSLTKVAELLQAPVATSVSGKGAIDECHPLAVGWGYGPQATVAAENAFKAVDVVLAVGSVRYSEVSTGCYAIPPHRCLSSRWTPTPTTSAASSSRRSASTPTPVFSSNGCWPPPTTWADRPTPLWPAASATGSARKPRSAAAATPAAGADPMLFLLALPHLGDLHRRAADLRGRDLFAVLGGRGLHGSPAAHLLQPDPTTKRWAGRSRRRSGRSASTPAGRSSP